MPGQGRIPVFHIAVEKEWIMNMMVTFYGERDERAFSGSSTWEICLDL